MLAFAGIGVFVERGSIEIGQPVGVFREMPGHPIDDHADSGLVAAIDEVHEVLRRAESRRGRIDSP